MDQLFSEKRDSNSETHRYKPPELTVRELSREIVAIEQEVPLDHATGKSYHNVYTSLTQSHLDRLDAIEAIRYDPDRKTVEPDHNLLALASVATSASPLIRLLFRDSTAELDTGGSDRSDSITD